jgi:hypothetical protein
MITEALLLDKIKALISGYQNKGHYLYGKSDSQVASILQSYLSSYLNESKQLIIEKNWKPPGVDPVKTYSGTKFPSEKYKNTFLKFKQELKDNFGINVKSTSAYRDAYNQARIMYVNWCQKSKNLRRTGETDQSLLRRRRKYLIDLYAADGTVGKLADIFDKYWLQSHDSRDWISDKQLTAALAEAEKLLKNNPVSLHQAKQAVDIVGYGAGNIKKILDFVKSGKSKYAKKALYEKDHFHIVLNVDYQDDSDIEVSKTADDAGFRQEPAGTLRRGSILKKITVNPDQAGFKQLPVLRYGKTGDEVKKVQQKLIDIYGDDILSKYGVDGRYGIETISAVKKFQKDNPPLKVDGIVGPNTYEKLNIDFQTESVMEMISNNPKFRKILIEETRRAQRLLFEYNEEQTWDSMTDDQKHDALLAVDDDMGPDIADEYTNMSWLRIPDVITNRVDLRPYMKQQPDRRSMMHVRSLIRGIKSRAQEDANAAKFVKAYLAKTMAQNVEDLTSQQVEDLMFKLHDFQASLSNFVAPTPEEQEQSSQAAYNYYKSMPGNWKGD